MEKTVGEQGQASGESVRRITQKRTDFYYPFIIRKFTQFKNEKQIKNNFKTD